ncbi:MAG: EAL domain-containing protein [Tepidimonas ignava]
MRRWAATSAWLVAGLAALSVGATGYVLWTQRHDALERAHHTVALHAAALEDTLTQTLHVVELTARTQAADGPPAQPAADVLLAAIRPLPFVRSLSLTDATGRVLVSSNPRNVGLRIDLEALYPVGHPEADVVRIGSPVQARDWSDRGVPAPDGVAPVPTFVPLGLPLIQGEQLRWIVVALNPDHFTAQAQRLFGPGTLQAMWLRYDGAPLWSTSTAGTAGGLPAEALTTLVGWTHQTIADTHTLASEHVHEALIVGHRSSGRYAATVVVWQPESAALQGWHRQARYAVGTLVPLLLALAALGALLWRRGKALARQQRQLQLTASVFHHAQEAVVITDPHGTIVDANEAFTAITGYDRQEVLGRNTRLLSSGRQDRAFYQAMWAELIAHGRWSGEIWNRRKNGEVYAELLTISAVRDAQGRVQHYVGMFSDITRLKEHEQALQRIAHYDALTGLPNRVLLHDRLRQAMARTRRSQRKLAVVFLDLDGFKGINDRHGHAVGDQLLVQLAQRMQQALRGGDTLGRLGGDEFVAVLQDLDDHTASIPVLQRLLLAAATPVVVDGHTLQVTASLGLAFYPQHSDVDADQLLRQADQAMYQAKLSGKNRYHVFDAEHDAHLRSRHEMLEAIRQALHEGQFVLHYQPKVNMRDGTVLGFEALLRWQHPQRGLLGPAAFLRTVEEHPLGLELGRWVLAEAVRQVAHWKTQGLHTRVSVNLDAQQLQDHTLVHDLERVLADHPTVQPQDLCLEVLETTAVSDIQAVVEVIDACQRRGVTFALDDFGTGYSSLAYLRQLPAQELKIDQSFVRDMLEDPSDLAILQGVLALAWAFQRDVVAEGVETVEHGAMLLRLGCEWGQGWAIARPMPADEVPAWCARWRPPAAWTQVGRLATDEVPVVFAMAHHRQWMRAILAYLDGRLNTAPELDAARCTFGHWLDHLPAHHAWRGDGRLAHIQGLHQQVHDDAARLVALARAGTTPMADHPDRQALQAASDALIEALLQLTQHPVAPAPHQAHPAPPPPTTP